ncbi:hypothetical protein [Allohahella marinimesophila]
MNLFTIPVFAKGYFPHVDGLRAIAVLAVVLFHADFWSSKAASSASMFSS